MKKFISSMILSSMLTISIQAHALSIKPASPLPYKTGTDYTTGNQNSNDIIKQEISALNLGAVLLYKDNVGGSEEGSLATSYATSFNNSPSDPSGATITFTGGNYIGDPQYLVVKDGNNTPWWYLFDLTNLWDGKETLQLSEFWPNQGAISYVALYGTDTPPPPPVPEPGTIVLLGAGLLGLAVYGRKRIKK